MQSYHLVALLIALTAAPSFLIARWLRQGRMPIAGGAPHLTEGRRRALDDRLARLMRMVGLAMLAAAGGIALWGADERRVLALVAVMVLAVNGLAIAMVLTVARARRGEGPGTGR